MDIKTRFNINDEIFYLSQEGIRPSKIVGMNIYSTNDVMLTNGDVFDSDIVIAYRTDSGFIIKENNCFGSKEELLEYLNK